MYKIENDDLLVKVSSLGAELQQIHHKQTGLEYLWDAKPEFWAKHSPILFPIVGTLKDNTYNYKGNSYQLGRHGFAREMEFTVLKEQNDLISFGLQSNEKTLESFPFQFKLEINYQLKGNQLLVTYIVRNETNDELLFSIGAHPAFRVPLTGNTSYDDWFLEFNEKETQGRWPISKDGLIELAPKPLLENSQKLTLSKSLFATDAIVLKDLKSTSVKLASDKSEHGFEFLFPGFPYLGIWAAKNADFVCIEPWYGIADSVDSNQQFDKKEGIQKLATGKNFECSWSANFY